MPSLPAAVRRTLWSACGYRFSASTFQMQPWECRSVYPAKDLIRDQSDQADDDDAGEDLVGLQEPLRLQNRITQTRVGRDQLGHHEVGPGPTHGDAHGVH